MDHFDQWLNWELTSEWFIFIYFLNYSLYWTSDIQSVGHCCSKSPHSQSAAQSDRLYRSHEMPLDQVWHKPKIMNEINYPYQCSVIIMWMSSLPWISSFSSIGQTSCAIYWTNLWYQYFKFLSRFDDFLNELKLITTI